MRIVLSTVAAGAAGHPEPRKERKRKKNLNLNFIPYTKITSKSIMGLKVKHKTSIKFLEKK